MTTPQNDKLKSIIEEFRKNFDDMTHVGCKGDLPCATMKTNVEDWFTAKLTEYGASEREAGAKEERQKNIDTAFSVANATHEVILEKQIAEAHAAGREEAIRECMKIIGEHNARILNQFQHFQLGDERILFAPIEKATEQTKQALLSLQKGRAE